MKKIIQVLSVSFTVLFFSSSLLQGQSRMSQVMDTATLQQQFDYIQKKTKIYDRFRAIREDYFQKVKGNALDSLNRAYGTIASLQERMIRLEAEIDSLQQSLATTQQQLEEVTRTKNSLLFLGMRMNKTAYNALMWSLVIALAALLVILLLMYKRAHAVTARTKKELQELQEEFENYRKSTRERIEKMTIAHHREIQKLKGKQ